MSYTTAGLPLQQAHSTIRPTQALLSPASRPVMSTTLTGPAAPSPGTSCCQTGRPVMTDPVTGQTVCSCQLTPSLAVSYPRLAALPESLYGSAAAYSAQALMASSPFAAAAAAASNGAPEASSLYSPFATMSPYELKDAAEVYRGLTQPPAGLLAYDPTAMFTYPFGAGYGGMDLSAARRNKNATRETTSTLKAWLYEHRKNPYPTKGEKIMLAIITKMTLTQVSTWFANARRRLKKDNKMTWTPKNGSGAESDNDDDDNNNDHGGGDDKELDVGSTSDNNATLDTDHRLDDSRDSIDIDTLSDKDPSEALRDGDGPEDVGRVRTSSPDREDQPHHHQNTLDHHPHHHSHHHPHHHHHHHPSTADHLRQQRSDQNRSPVGGVNGGLMGPRGPPYGPPPTSLAALQRTQAGPFHMPYPTSMAHRMTLPTMTSSPAEGLPGLRPNHAFAPSSISSSSTSSSTAAPINTSRSTSSPPETSGKDSSSSASTTVTNNNKPKIWSLADIVTSSSSNSTNSNNASSITSASSPGKPSPVRPSPGGAGLPHSALGSLRAWTEATGGPYGLAAAVAAAQGLHHPYSRAGPMPPHGVAGMPTMPGAFSLPAGIPLMPTQHQNGFYSTRPAERLNMSDGLRSESPSSSDENKTAFKPVTKSKPTEVNV